VFNISQHSEVTCLSGGEIFNDNFFPQNLLPGLWVENNCENQSVFMKVVIAKTTCIVAPTASDSLPMAILLAPAHTCKDVTTPVHIFGFIHVKT